MPMTFLEATQICVAKYGDFSGRATRAEYWWFFLAVAIGSAAAATVGPTLYTLFTIAAVVPLLAAGSRRLHDANLSGWWQVLVVIPFGAVLVAFLLAIPSAQHVPQREHFSARNTRMRARDW